MKKRDKFYFKYQNVKDEQKLLKFQRGERNIKKIKIKKEKK